MTEAQLEKAIEIDRELRKLKSARELLEIKNARITVSTHTSRLGYVEDNVFSLDEKFNAELKKLVDEEIERLEKELEAL